MTRPRSYDALILGGSFAGVCCAQRLLKRLRGTGRTVALISRENHMVFRPMLAEVVDAESKLPGMLTIYDLLICHAEPR